MDRWYKQRWEESERRRKEVRRSEKRKKEKKESAGARKGRKVTIHCVFFPMICGSGGSKSRLAKEAGAEPAGQMRDKKLHAVVARSTCRSQNVQNTPKSEHFWKLRCQKSARRFWREAHLKVTMYKTRHSRTTFGSWDVEKVHSVVARSTCPSQNVQSTWAPEHFWTLRCRKVHAVVARSTFPSQNVQGTKCSDHFWGFICGFSWQAQGIV